MAPLTITGYYTNPISLLTLQATNSYFTGNVGIGITSPFSPLQVSGNLSVGSGASAGVVGLAQLTTGGSSPISNRLTFGTDGTGWKFAISKNQAGTVSDLMTIQDNGNVGIGSTSPANTLDVNGTGIHIASGTPGSTTYQLYNNAGTLTWNGTALATGGAGGTIVTLTDGSTVSVNAALGTIFNLTLTGNHTLANPTNLTVGQLYVFNIFQDGTGNRSLTFGSAYNFNTSLGNIFSRPLHAKLVFIHERWHKSF